MQRFCLGGMLLCLAVACAGPSSVTHLEDRATLRAGDTPDLRAARANFDAARARIDGPSVWNHVDVRFRDLSVENFAHGGENLGLATRLDLDNPWAIDALESARFAELEVALSQLEGQALALEAKHCARSIQAHGEREHRLISERQRAQLEGVLDWTEAWLEAGQLDELTAARTRLALSSALNKRVVIELHPEEAQDAFPLPELRSASALKRDEAEIRGLLRASQPALMEHEAEARRQTALAQRDRVQRWPWLDFLELSYAVGDNADAIKAQVALEIPFGFDLAAEAERHEALVERERFQAETLENTSLRLVKERLERLDHFEGRQAELAALIAQADEAEAVAERWLAGRIGEPRSVAQLFEEVFGARKIVLELRVTAGFAGCDVFALTHVGLLDWPRGP